MNMYNLAARSKEDDLLLLLLLWHALAELLIMIDCLLSFHVGEVAFKLMPPAVVSRLMCCKRAMVLL